MCYLWTKLLKRRLMDLEFHPIEFRCLFLSVFLLKKDNTNRVSSNNFLLILTKFYILILLYRVLHFFFFVEIIQHIIFCFSVCECVFTLLIKPCRSFKKTISCWSKAFFIFSYNNMRSIWVTNVTVGFTYLNSY